jgi:outer membrane protein
MKFRITLLFIFIPWIIMAQDSLLTLQRAVEIALENNFNIRISKNISEQAQNNNSAGNAGMLPNIDVYGSYTNANTNIHQEYNNGSEIERDNSGSDNINADIAFTWTIFDGLRMFYSKEKLSEQSMQSYDQLKINIENSIVGLYRSYFNIVRHQQLIHAIREELILSEERMRIAERKLNNGSGSRLELLQARTEYNRQHSTEITLLAEADKAKYGLNQILGRQPETIFNTEDTVIISYRPVLDELKRTVEKHNSTLSFLVRGEKIAGLQLKETSAQRWPRISFNTHYIYNRSTNEAGFSLLNQSRGFTYGFTAVLPLFHGFNINREVKNSRLEMLNARLQYESGKNNISTELHNAWKDYSSSLEFLKIEEENIGFAREVLQIAHERYRIGLSNSIELQEAQRTFEEAMTRLTNARYNAKISETTLRQLNGDLVKME